jgi:hypothetical protein
MSLDGHRSDYPAISPERFRRIHARARIPPPSSCASLMRPQPRLTSPSVPTVHCTSLRILSGERWLTSGHICNRQLRPEGYGEVTPSPKYDSECADITQSARVKRLGWCQSCPGQDQHWCFRVACCHATRDADRSAAKSESGTTFTAPNRHKPSQGIGDPKQ